MKDRGICLIEPIIPTSSQLITAAHDLTGKYYQSGAEAQAALLANYDLIRDYTFTPNSREASIRQVPLLTNGGIVMVGAEQIGPSMPLLKGVGRG